MLGSRVARRREMVRRRAEVSTLLIKGAVGVEGCWYVRIGGTTSFFFVSVVWERHLDVQVLLKVL